MEVEVNVGDDVADVKVDESEVGVAVEDEGEVAAAESIFVVVSMRKLRRGHKHQPVTVELDILQALWFSSLSPLAQTAVYYRIGTLQVGRSRELIGLQLDDVDMIDACSNFCVNQRSLLWIVI